MNEGHRIVGRLLRASNRGFTFGCRLLAHSDKPIWQAAAEEVEFGAWMCAPAQNGRTQLYGLVYEIQVTDDGLARQLSVTEEALLSEPRPDERHHRAAPNEVSVLTVGYCRDNRWRYGPAPQPPLSLDAITTLLPDEVRAFTAHWDWLKLVLDTREVPAGDLAVAGLLHAAESHPPEERYAYLVEAGRQLARLVTGDTIQLEALLRRLRP